MSNVTSREYKNERDMQKDIAKMAKRGWIVQSSTQLDKGYNVAKGCFLGALFFPLFLLGKRRPHYLVVYVRQSMNTANVHA